MQRRSRENDLEMLLSSLRQSSCKTDQSKGENCSVVRRIKIMDSVFSRLNRSETIQLVVSAQFKGSFISVGLDVHGTEDLHIWKGTIKCPAAGLLSSHMFTDCCYKKTDCFTVVLTQLFLRHTMAIKFQISHFE